ncbi:hypothetical protein chiPu_0017120 [Chiloscyllium punctatum]|uniref:Lipoxygenase domain-containing protein n=1 Tax=Chiloscyllium punctatum TaxID=137246 RepID=A0A401T7M3_CHIPU|nr:hypothetical protein [Chiloscyllium punctatum]
MEKPLRPDPPDGVSCQSKLGDYKQKYFTEEEVQIIIGKFQEELKKIDRVIQEYDENLVLKYEYMCPEKIENSVTI